MVIFRRFNDLGGEDELSANIWGVVLLSTGADEIWLACSEHGGRAVLLLIFQLWLVQSVDGWQTSRGRLACRHALVLMWEAEEAAVGLLSQTDQKALNS